ncbi:MAG: hypothetical protein R2712_05630 [Vicinamibacterales bacterium]
MVPFSGRSLGRAVALAALLGAGWAVPAHAQSSIGFSGGASVDPEQVYAGVFWQSADIAGRFRLRPGIEGGFGSGLRLATINVDFVYLFPLGNTPWKFLTGGGPSVVLTKLSDDRFDLGTDVGAGGSYLIGFAHDNGFFTDIRIGGGNVPGLKFGAGWSVRID